MTSYEVSNTLRKFRVLSNDLAPYFNVELRQFALDYDLRLMQETCEIIALKLASKDSRKSRPEQHS